MKWLACLVIAAACQQGKGDAPRSTVDENYRQDITNLCDAVHRSGADQKPAEERSITIAMWLGPHITTPAGHDFLVKIQPLQGAAKAAALEAEGRKVGLSGCALAAEWH